MLKKSTLMKLGELAILNTGKLNSNAADKYGKYPFFTCAQENYKTNTFSFNTECVILGGNNANGVYPLKFFSGKFDAYQRTYVIESKNKSVLINKYLYYAFRPRLELLKSYSVGVTTKFLTKTILNNLEFKIPSIDVQQKIASILSAYDDLIENNLRRIQILEEMAQMIYREWFVHFRFPGHENIKMVESSIGMIPESWDVVAFTDAVELNPSVKILNKEKIPYVGMDGLSTNSMTIKISGYRSKISGSKFQNGDILFARITPCLENGKTGIVDFLNQEHDAAIGSTEFIVFRSRTLIPEFVYLLARTNNFRDLAIKSMTGASGRQRVQKECFVKYKFAHPKQSVLNKFTDNVQPMFQLLKSLNNKNENLRKTRDILLPILISGEIDVSEMDIKVNE